MKHPLRMLILALCMASLACNFINQKQLLPFTLTAIPAVPKVKVIVPSPNGMTMGNVEATVKVEEFSDFQCPYCKMFYTDMEPGLVSKYVVTNKVLFVYNPFSFIGSESLLAAEAGYCAADQNKFWEMQDQIFIAQGAENSGVFSAEHLKTLASQSGLDPASFNACLDKGTNKAKVEQANKLAQERGVQSTPSFFVNGKGPMNSTELFAEIDKALQGQ